MYEQYKDTILKCVDALDDIVFGDNPPKDCFLSATLFTAWESLTNAANRLGYYDEENKEVK